jgi:hypothetical protein
MKGGPTRVQLLQKLSSRAVIQRSDRNRADSHARGRRISTTHLPQANLSPPRGFVATEGYQRIAHQNFASLMPWQALAKK